MNRGSAARVKQQKSPRNSTSPYKNQMEPRRLELLTPLHAMQVLFASNPLR